MEVSSQLYAPASLPQVEQLPVPIGYEAGWVFEQVWTWWWSLRHTMDGRNN